MLLFNTVVVGQKWLKDIWWYDSQFVILFCLFSSDGVQYSSKVPWNYLAVYLSSFVRLLNAKDISYKHREASDETKVLNTAIFL